MKTLEQSPTTLDGKTLKKASADISEQMAHDAELAQSVTDWQEATHLLVGAILHKHGRGSIELSPKDFQKFHKRYFVKMTTTPSGSTRYQVVSRKREH